MQGLDNNIMVEGVTVKFRWFRTIETTDNTVKLVSSARSWDAIELVWDNLRLVYESGPTFMVCGKHKGILVIDNRRFRCEKFTIVPTTLEVNVFVQDDDKTSREPCNDHNPCLKLKSDELSSFFNVNRNNSLSVLSDSVSLASSRSINVYEEMLEAKDDEIDDLQQQLDQLKLALVATEAENSKLRTLKSNFEFEVGNVSFGSEPHKFVIGNDSTGINELLDEMRSLRNRLHSYSRKNKELYKEMFRLRAENTKLQAEQLHKPRFQLKSTDSVYYSDPESNSTQYKELPLTRLSRSLPDTLGLATKKVSTLRRRPVTNLGCGDDSPLSVESLQTDEFLSYGTPSKIVSAVQTDITAVKGLPKRYRSGSKVQVKKCLFGDVSEEAKPRRNYRRRDENDDSEDTEELLRGADRFLRNVYGGDTEPIIDHQHNNPHGSSSKVKSFTCALPTPPYNKSSFVDVSSSNRINVRPFLPKCALDLKVGHRVRYLGPNGRVSQGIVTFIGQISGKVGTFIGVEDDGVVANSYLSSTPCANFVPFKKVILAWENLFS